jgi:hypothetical protein
VRCQKSEILTSSPFKNAIEMKNERKAKPKLKFYRIIKGKKNKSKTTITCEKKEKRQKQKKTL